MKGLRSRPVTVLPMLVLAAAILALAAYQVSRYASYGDVRYWAGRIEAGTPLQSGALAASVRRAASIADEGECQARFVKAGLVVLFAAIDEIDQDKDYESWSEALQRADRLAAHALTCLPTDGGLWLRLAMTRQAVAEQPEEVARYLFLSQLYAPSEQAVIRGRYLLYNEVSATTLGLLSDGFESDLRLVCSNAMDYTRADLPPPGPALAPIISSLHPDCPKFGG